MRISKLAKKYSSYLVPILAKTCTLPITLLASSLVGRTYGPIVTGYIAFSISTISIISSITHLGGEGVLVRELVEHKKLSNKILSTVFPAKAIAHFIAFFIVIAYSFYLYRLNNPSYIYLLISAPMALFSIYNVYFSYLRSKSQHILLNLTQSFSGILLSFLNIFIAWLSLSPLLLPGLISIQSACTLIFAASYSHFAFNLKKISLKSEIIWQLCGFS